MPVFFAVVFLYLGFGFYCYQQALAGPFVLDDIPNFYGLGFVHDLSSALAYSYNGPAGTRWISYLSFTLPIEVDGWKNADAFSFKLINLIVHVINSLLVFKLLQQLLIVHDDKLPYLTLWALGVAAIWAIHPIHANTLLYSVQRMTLLASTAILLGLNYHLAFTSRHQQTVNTLQWLRYSGTIWGITAIGILCKESAVLLPLYILASHVLIPRRTFSRLQNIGTLVAPYLALLAYLIASRQLGFGGRNFTMGERLLSEVVILKEYAFKILLPSFDSFSLYYDDFIVVKSPAENRFLLSAMFWLVFISMARFCKNAIPWLWFGCLWFLAGHALESTIIPLELYFDHRNYLPSLGIVIVMAFTFRYFLDASHNKSIRLLLFVLAISLGGKYLHDLKTETGYWHNDQELAESLIAKHPDSLRATQNYVEMLIAQGKYRESIRVIDYIYTKFGIHASTAIFQVGFSCLSQPHVIINHQKLVDDLKNLPEDSAVSDAMDFLMTLTREKTCPSLTWEMYEKYTDSLLSNPAQRRHYHNLVFLLVSSHMSRHDEKAALQSSFKLPKSLHTPGFVLLQMHLSLSTKNITAAETVYTDITRFGKVAKILYKDDIAVIEMKLEKLRHETKN